MALGKIKADTLEHSTSGSVDTKFVVEGSAKAWCLWEQDSTQAVTTSLNVSSIADGGTGVTTQTFTNSFSNVNFSPTYNASHDSGNYVGFGATAHDTPPTSSTLTVDYLNTSASLVDVELASSHVVGDLA
jgi:hypothetical protein